MKLVYMALMILMTLWLSKSNAYTDYACVNACTARGLLYDSCVAKCSDEPQRNMLRESQDAYDRQQRDFDQTMRMREQNERSGGRSAFDLINGGR